MQVSFNGAIANKALLDVIHSANQYTKGKPIRRHFLMKDLRRIHNGPFSKINLKQDGDSVQFDFVYKYTVHKMVKDKVTKKFTKNVTHHEHHNYFETDMPKTKNPAYTLISRVSTYLSPWDK